MNRNSFVALAVVTLLVAVFLRFHELNTFPPGPHYDEAANILISKSIAFDGAAFFPYVLSYQGRETLYHYLGAVMLQTVGYGDFSMRLTGAFLSVIGVAASIGLGRAMFRGRRGYVVGLVAGLVMVLSFHQMWLGRQIFRAVSQPTMQALALLFLWRGLRYRAGGWRWLIIGGIFGGLTIYTYHASRLFPLWLLAGGGMLLFVDRANWRARFMQGIVFFGVMLVVILPMIQFALSSPDIFLNRLYEVTEESSITLTESIILHLRMLFIEGDPYLLYNIPHRPYLTPPEGALLLIGLVISFWRIAKATYPEERAAYWLVFLSPLMILPGVISPGGLPPSHMRSVGMVPLIFVVVAVAFETAFSTLVRYFNRDVNYRLSFVGLFVVILVTSTPMLWGAYANWAIRSDLYVETDAGLAVAAAWLPDHVDDSTRVYVGSRYREHPTMLAGYEGAVTWLGTSSFYLPPTEQDALYIFAQGESVPDGWLKWLSPVEELPAAPDGQPAFYAYRFDADAFVLLDDFAEPAGAIQNPYLSYIGLDSEPIMAGNTGEITLYWHINEPPPYYGFTPLVEVFDDAGVVLARSDAYLMETNRWVAGETYLQKMIVAIPETTPPGDYFARMTWVDRDSGGYVSFVHSDGRQAGVWAEIGVIEVVRPQSFPARESIRVDVPYGEELAAGVRVLGWSELENLYRPGENMMLSLVWESLPSDEQRASLELTIIIDDETALWVGQPVLGTENWLDSEILTQNVRVSIPRDTVSGTYTVSLVSGGVRLAVDEIRVEGKARLFDAPEVEHVVQANFEGGIQLYGYSLKNDDVLHIDLVWYVTTIIYNDYTIFLHIINDEGEIVAQRDVKPQNNQYPITLWAAGEYVVDEHIFSEIEQGTYDIRIGLYSQSSGERLQLPDFENKYSVDFFGINKFDIVGNQVLD